MLSKSLEWNPTSDTFSFDGVDIPVKCFITKRMILSCIARLFDPLGLLTPFIILVKIMFQELWKLGLAWDDSIPEEFQKQFILWARGIDSLKSWEIPRSYFPESAWREIQYLEIHGFCDSSEKAYGALVYLRLPTEEDSYKEDSYKVTLVISRAKVAPIKKVTLPRLELLSVLLCARLIVFVKKTLKLDDNIVYRCWTDSMIALSWIKGEPHKWKTFVANRVAEIQDLTAPAYWCHCSSSQNPADLLTRGLYADKLIKIQTWLDGPRWLSQNFDLDLKDSKAEPTTEETVLLSHVAISEAPKNIIPYDKWSSFSKVLNIIGWCLRFVKNLKSKRSERQIGFLRFEELLMAKQKVFKSVQMEHYFSEIEFLEKRKPLPKNSPIAKLNPCIGDDGLLRLKSRLQLAELAYEESHPIILPQCHVTSLLVKFQHEILKHAGVNTLISSLRGSYWIIGLRRTAKRIKRECIACKKQDTQACNQMLAPLPKLRVNQAPPFTVTGMDYAGPVFCVDKPKQKLYILLFTCGVIRAVHLELTDSLSLPDFLLAFRRFSARRGLPTVVYSDNAKTFQAAESTLLKYFGHLSPEWKFIAPRSPWWGGWWERLIRSIKSALKKTLGVCCLQKSELETTLHEIEACINSRPLTFVGDDLDSSQPLTPSHFLIGRSAGFQPEVSNNSDIIISAKSLSSREAILHDRLSQFWTRWTQDYLRNLPPTANKFKS